MEINILVLGKMIFNMARVRKAGLMAQSTWADTKMERSTEEESIVGVTAVNMMDFGLKTK